MAIVELQFGVSCDSFSLSLRSTSNTICIGNNFHHVNPYIEITTVISDSHAHMMVYICSKLQLEKVTKFYIHKQ